VSISSEKVGVVAVVVVITVEAAGVAVIATRSGIAQHHVPVNFFLSVFCLHIPPVAAETPRPRGRRHGCNHGCEHNQQPVEGLFARSLDFRKVFGVFVFDFHSVRTPAEKSPVVLFRFTRYGLSPIPVDALLHQTEKAQEAGFGHEKDEKQQLPDSGRRRKRPRSHQFKEFLCIHPHQRARNVLSVAFEIEKLETSHRSTEPSAVIRQGKYHSERSETTCPIRNS